MDLPLRRAQEPEGGATSLSYKQLRPQCCAIDYTRHTLDGAAQLLNSNKYFPSRVSIKESSIAKIGSICRRVYRIFSHAYFHHRALFDAFEAETHLCRRFTVYVTKYGLMSAEHLIVPILPGQQVVNTATTAAPPTPPGSQ